MGSPSGRSAGLGRSRAARRRRARPAMEVQGRKLGTPISSGRQREQERSARHFDSVIFDGALSASLLKHLLKGGGSRSPTMIAFVFFPRNETFFRRTRTRVSRLQLQP